MSAPVTPFRYIREIAFAEPVAARFAEAISISRPHLSRLERGERPSHDLMTRVRTLASDRQVRWDDAWFFEVPAAGGAEQDAEAG